MNMDEGVQIRLLKTDKFKDIGCSIRFLNPLTAKEATARSLLALMLCDRCEKYDTKQKMADIADELYGITLNAQTMGYGKAQVLEIRSKIINPRYVQDDQLLKTWLDFLHEVIFRPKKQQGKLDQELFQEAKEILQFKMDRSKDEPSQWSVMRCLQLAGEGTALGISALGDPALLANMQISDVSDVYEAMIQTAPIEIIVCGDFDEAQMRDAIKSAFPFTSRKPSELVHYAAQISKREGIVEEYRDISQTSVMMLWFTHTEITDKDYWKLKVANAMLGQYSPSLLFQEVREKNSLCYSIFSNLISFDGALGIMTGIEKENLEKTLDLIHIQMDRMKNGEFDEELLTTSKMLLINSLRSTKDDMGSLFSLAYQNALLKQQSEIEDLVKIIQNTTKEDVVRVMKKCTHALTYVLTKEDDHEENNK